MFPVSASRPVSSSATQPTSKLRRFAAASLDIEKPNVAGVALNELLARLHLVAHQVGERLLDRGGGRLVDADALEGTAAGIHGRLAELFGVHLTEPLEPLDLDALPAELEHGSAQLREAVGLLLLL